MSGTPIDREKVWTEFTEAVNMTPSKLQKWLETDESKAAGWSGDDGGETIGRHSGRRIVEIKHKHKTDLTDDDYAHMRKVVGYVHRHLAQGGPKEDLENSTWRHSLMNWGHDPMAD
ncbi:DUF3140 domain-containing protein [Aureimonas fodinaquatilis]|uniref:DUF3140 domain-containing protein n=1 Tax=Aureimonas fodinaquatilis TaxID=2565783 RepID=A0A5B0DXI1_9HYPH|nr:DUF3140 domain-containing protein [Aureimonas fodinaquatilis]KAA0970451.1 DUF3140 domain-containing protein [Aureimonas fodinaquatilis]